MLCASCGMCLAVCNRACVVLTAGCWLSESHRASSTHQLPMHTSSPMVKLCVTQQSAHTQAPKTLRNTKTPVCSCNTLNNSSQGSHSVTAGLCPQTHLPQETPSQPPPEGERHKQTPLFHPSIPRPHTETLTARFSQNTLHIAPPSRPAHKYIQQPATRGGWQQHLTQSKYSTNYMCICCHWHQLGRQVHT